MEVLLREIAPRMVPNVELDYFSFEGKDSLLRKLPARLRGYAGYLSETSGALVIVVDRDSEDCLKLKSRITGMVEAAGLCVDMIGSPGSVLVRVAIEEMEAWLLGDVAALRREFPRVPLSLAERAKYRDPDGIAGGTWEALERVLREAGAYQGGLAKVDCAARVSPHMHIEDNRSPSFVVFRDGLRRLTGAA